ncbi:MAG: aspartate oxidase [Sulfuricurvum sp. PC08-66]|nr:MAG: aspartate oxidase [Sulfuricurvum sp. PC08-66]
MQYDYLIIGAGVAGLYAALNIPTSKRVLIVSKNNPWECNTFYAQGGVATAVDAQDIDAHIADTMLAGCGVNNRENVRLLVEQSITVIDDLIARGFVFDTDVNGRLLYTKEAAHSASRILHAGGDATGRYIHHFLLEQNAHPMVSAQVIDLLIEGEYCYGATLLHNDGNIENIYANATIIASGGVGALFEYHTNARRISGDIQGIAVEKGLPLEDMEMMQFHPTVYVGSKLARKQLLTEALRGEGATIVNEEGRRFVFDVHELGELAPRDVVSRAIFYEAKKGNGKIYLDFSSFEPHAFHERFPNITKSLAAFGYTLPQDRVPISPAFHYALGGIKTDRDALVVGMKNLYAVGEVACTGVHGANRLASNSLIEGLVFAKQATHHASQHLHVLAPKSFALNATMLFLDGDEAIKQELRQIMWDDVGIVRTREGLLRAKTFIDGALSQSIGRLVRLRLLTAKAIVEAALKRETSLGVHYIT